MESRVRASPEQLLTLLEYMETHGDLARPLAGSQGRAKSDRLWNELTNTLNAVGGGVSKTTDKWKKVWADWKSKTKKKAFTIRHHARGTGGGPASKQTLSATDERVLAIMGALAVEGQASVEELGFNRPQYSAQDDPVAHDDAAVYLEIVDVMSGAGAELLVLGYDIAPGLLVGASLILILETMWVAALFVDLLCRRGEYTLSLRCWDFFRWSCGRARAAMYACGATALLFAHLTLLATISGGMLLVLAALRAAVPFSPYATHGPHSPRAGSSLLSQHDSPLPDVFYNAGHTEEDRSEEMTVLDIKTTDRSRSTTPKPPLLNFDS